MPSRDVSLTILQALVVLAVLVGKEWYFHGDPVKAGLGMHGEGSWNRSLRLGAGGPPETMVLSHVRGMTQDKGGSAPRRTPNVPEDVRLILRGIAERNRERKKAFPEVPVELSRGHTGSMGKVGAGSSEENAILRVLDEL